MKKVFITFAIIATFGVLIFSCNSSTTNNTGDNSENNINNDIKEDDKLEEVKEEDNTNNIVSQEFEQLSINKDDVSKDLYKGEWETGEKWTDKNGENILVVSIVTKEKEEKADSPSSLTKEIHFYHYVITNGKSKLIREVKDYENNCIFDNRLRLAEGSISITDLDKDNYAEICFVYFLGCTSELSPDNMKLILLENGDKYAIRGNTYVKEFSIGGETNVDGNFKKGPEDFLALARMKWDSYQTHK